MPKCSGAVATTLSAAPAPLVLLYTKVVWCERVPVTTVVWNLEGGNLVAAVSARERNDDRAISRNRAPATICNVLHQFAPKCTASRAPRRTVSNVSGFRYRVVRFLWWGCRRPWNVLTGAQTCSARG